MNRGRKEFVFFSLAAPRAARWDSGSSGNLSIGERRSCERRDQGSLRSIEPDRKAVNERLVWLLFPIAPASAYGRFSAVPS